MLQLTKIESPQTFDFEANKEIEMNLETLKRTQPENDACRRPLKGLYHYEAIERIADAATERGLVPVIADLWAGQNNSRTSPGVALLPEVEAVRGEKAVEAHILRRIFCTLNLQGFEDAEKCTNIALAWHQDGVQVAIGQRVHICKNQTILGAQYSAISRGNDRDSINALFATVCGWLDNIQQITTEQRNRIESLKNWQLTREQALSFYGLFNCMRIAADSKEKNLRDRVSIAPLNQAQLTTFGENLTRQLLLSPVMSAWDFCNLATEIHKPARTDIPRIIPANAALFDVMGQIVNAEVFTPIAN